MTSSGCWPKTLSWCRGPETERLASLARNHGLWLVIGVEERERGGGTIYNTLLYFSPDGVLAGRHRS